MLSNVMAGLSCLQPGSSIIKHSSTLYRAAYKSHTVSTIRLASYKPLNEIGVQLLPKHLHEKVFKPAPTIAEHGLAPANKKPANTQKTAAAGKNITIVNFAKNSSQGLGVDNDTAPVAPNSVDSKILEVSKLHLRKNGLLQGNSSQYDERFDNLNFELPDLLGNNIEQHFQNLGSFRFQKFYDLAEKLSTLREIPIKPDARHFLKKSGWVKYSFNPDTNKFDIAPVPGISDNLLIFDVETMFNLENYPCLAAAMSFDSWYVWMSPYLVGESNNFRHLIHIQPPSSSYSANSTAENQKTLSPSHFQQNEKLIIGHNIGFDRAKIYEEYRLKESSYQYIDTMSLHIAASGLCSQQRPLYNKITKITKESELDEIVSLDSFDPANKFAQVSCTNSLKAIAQFYLNVEVDKSVRNVFVDGSISQVREDLNNCLGYCIQDVALTAMLFQKLFKTFAKQCPHPVTFAGMLIMSSSFLPVVPNKWQNFINSADTTVNELKDKLEDRLLNIARQHTNVANPENDPWLKHLDWGKSYVKYKKAKKPKVKATRATGKKNSKKNGDKETETKNGKQAESGVATAEMTEAQAQAQAQSQGINSDIFDTAPEEPELVAAYLPSYLTKVRQNPELENKPNWFVDLWDDKEKKFKLTTRTRQTPYLLNLSWNGFPMQHLKKYGWVYVVCKKQLINPTDAELLKVSTLNPINFYVDHKAKNVLGNQKIKSPGLEGVDIEKYNYYKIPHKDGEEYNVGNPLSKEYSFAVDAGVLTSPSGLEKDAIEISILGSYWMSARDRIKGQAVVPIKIKPETQSGSELAPEPITARDKANSTLVEYTYKDDKFETGIILPMVVPMGTITRRAVESTWATASNAKSNRIGSELKSLIEAPKGYKFVGADVDSEELWICSLIGDSQFGIHGSTALGYMCLLGSKASGDDMHSNTAKILGIDRNGAKVFNYSRIYGAGVKHATALLMQSNPQVSEEEARNLAITLYLKTKGIKNRDYKISKKLKFEGKTGSFWYGGSESYMFNSLEDIACSDDPRTPVLNCGIAAGLQAKNAGNMFMPSRVNWVVQSSGVDYLHLLLVSMDHLIRKFKIDARFMISVHDEVRYICADQDVSRCALALQISNLWVRSLFSYKLGLHNLPASVAFFSAVDVDFVLRKESNLDCVTPSNSVPLKHGKSYDIFDIVNQTGGKMEAQNQNHNQSQNQNEGKYNPTLVIDEEYDDTIRKASNANEANGARDNTTKPRSLTPEFIIKLKAQMANSKYELETLLGASIDQKSHTQFVKRAFQRRQAQC